MSFGLRPKAPISLLEELRADAPERRHAALAKVSALDAEDLGESLRRATLSALDDSVPEVRHAALLALTALASREIMGPKADALAAARALLADPNAAIRAEAAVLLAVLEDDSEPTTSRLIELVRDPSALVRREAAAALGDLKVDRARGTLLSALDDDDPDTCFEAAFALASLGDSRSLSVLTKFLRVPRKRLDACEAIRRLGDKAAVPALDALSKKLLLGWPERLVLWATLFALGDRDGGARVVERAASRNRGERTLALALIGSHRILGGESALLAVATSRKDKLRSTAIRSLGELATRDAMRSLDALANDATEPEELREEARAASERARLEAARKT
ncbi:MAG: HEAT repeat domain-containing protein [Deltaproteobacteria bacterium]|nr:HEAT repeat domain-containing protein [Deltaproteobacteria bacterium]